MMQRNHRIFAVLLAIVLAASLTGCFGKGKKDPPRAGGGGAKPPPKPPPTTIEVCPPVDIVFVMDTSGSMTDEGEALCALIAGVEDDLEALGLDVLRVTLLGISKNGAEALADEGYEGFDCILDSVRNLLGGDVPGSPPTDEETIGYEDDEDWAGAAAIVADRFEWLTAGTGEPDTIRIVVPISDESPETNDDDCFPIDTESVTNAAAVAVANGVIVSMIVADEAEPCILTLAELIAEATGGTASSSEDPGADFAETIIRIIEAACEEVEE